MFLIKADQGTLLQPFVLLQSLFICICLEDSFVHRFECADAFDMNNSPKGPDATNIADRLIVVIRFVNVVEEMFRRQLVASC